MTVNLKLFDIHGCVYHKFGQIDYKGEPHEDWVIGSNGYLLAELEGDLTSGQYKKTIFAYGTNAQSYAIDRCNYRKGGSITRALPLLQKHLAQSTKKDILFDPFLMADIYTAKEVEAGDSFNAIVKANPLQYEIHHAGWMFDESKVSLIYAHAHRMACLNPNEDIVIDFYDDSDDVIKGIRSFFEKNPNFLPRNVVLNLKKYDGSGPPLQRFSIAGTGITDKFYEWTVRLMAAKTHFCKSISREINTAEELLTYHKTDHCLKCHSGSAMNALFLKPPDISEILEFRANQFAALPSAPGLHRSVYICSTPVEAQKSSIQQALPDEEKKPLPSESKKNQDTEDNALISHVKERIEIYLGNEKYPKAGTEPNKKAYFSRKLNFDTGFNRAQGYLTLLNDDAFSMQYKLFIIHSLLAEKAGKKLKALVSEINENEISRIQKQAKDLYPDSKDFESNVQNVIAAANANGQSKKYDQLYTRDFFRYFNTKMYTTEALVYIRDKYVNKLQILKSQLESKQVKKSFFSSNPRPLNADESEALQNLIRLLQSKPHPNPQYLLSKDRTILLGSRFNKTVGPLLWLLKPWPAEPTEPTAAPALTAACS